VIQTKQMSDLVREGGFEIVSAGGTVGGKLYFGSVVSAWARVNTDVSFSNRACFRIVTATSGVP
jgi:hypothetical protein